MTTEPMIANRFRLVGELGRGGMGTVYRALDSLYENRPVALKIIRGAGATTPEFKLRFKEEFRTMVKLQHPNTIAVYDYGQLDDRSHFLTMEIVPGQELTELIRSRLPLDKAYSLLIQLLQALGFIHSRLYVHRDIKAENIRVREDGTLKLMDFGLMDRLGVAANGKITGTPGYLPPEVAKGGVIDASSDLYSVGCLAYEIFTGGLPFGGSLIEVIRGHIEREPQPLRALRPDLPARLETLVHRLLAKDQTQRYQSTAEVLADLADLAGVAVARQNLAQKTSYLTSSVLVGRDKELARLEALLEQATSGRARSAFVGAPAGVGKSRLVQELVLQAKLQGLTILHGQCLEKGMAPYEPFAELLRPLLAIATEEELATHGPVLAKLYPELAELGHAPLPILADGIKEKVRLNETVTAWVRGVAERVPLVLVMDDLHWSDLQSLESFNYLIRQADIEHACFIATFRNDEIPPSSAIWYTIEEALTDYLKLAPFNLPQSLLLLQAMLHNVQIGKEFGQFLFDATAGNAFFLTEVLRYLIEEGVLVEREGIWHFPADAGGLVLPTTVEATVLRRLDQVGTPARDLARVAAVLGRYQEREALLAISGLDEETLFLLLDELIERQFLCQEETLYTFPHDRVREALYGDIPADRRQNIHQRCAEFLEAASARDERSINELAHHYGLGHDVAKAYAYAHLAGNRAKEMGQAQVALAYWLAAERYLESIDYPEKAARQVELWLDIGTLGYQQWPAATIGSLEKFTRLMEAQGNATLFANFYRQVLRRSKRWRPEHRDRLARCLSFTGPKLYDFRPRRFKWGFGPASPFRWIGSLMLMNSLAACAYGFNGKPLKGLQVIERALELLAIPGTELEGFLRVCQCVPLLSAGRLDELHQTALRAGELLAGRTENLPSLLVLVHAGYANQLLAYTFQGLRPDPAMIEYGLSYADRGRGPNLKNVTLSRPGIWNAWTGRHEEATQFVEMMFQNSRKIGAPPYQWALYLRSYLLWQRGEFEEAGALLQNALRYPHINRDVFAIQNIYLLRGAIALALGDTDEAARDFEAVERESRENDLGLVLLQALLARFELAFSQGDQPLAESLANEALARSEAGPTANPLHEAYAARALARLALARGDHGGALAWVARAEAIVTRPAQDNRIEQGHLRQLVGDINVARGDTNAAHEAYRAAAAIFHGLKNRHLLNPVARQLEALQAPGLGASPFALPDEVKETRLSMLNTRWEVHYRSMMQTMASERQMHQAVLEACIDLLQADRAALFVNDAGDRPVLGQDRNGPCSLFPTNAGFIEQVRSSKQPLMAIDLPENLAIAYGSQLDMEMPSVLVAPVNVDGETQAILYLVRQDIASPFEEGDLPLANEVCSLLAHDLGERLAKRTLNAHSARLSIVADDLRASLAGRSSAGQTRHDLVADLLRDVAERFELDEVAMLVERDGQRRVIAHPADRPPTVNAAMLARLAEEGRSFCAIELPDDMQTMQGSNLDLTMASLALAPLRLPDAAFGALYCVRRRWETPIEEADLPSIEAFAEVLAERFAWPGEASAFQPQEA